jgi:hypothetical protein
VGYLFLTGGRIIHATIGHLSGEAAALEILSWTNGSFQPCERTWPEAASIESSYERLILEIARRRDEESASAGNLVAFPGRAAADPFEETASEEIEEIEVLEMNQQEGSFDMRGTTIEQPPTLPGARVEPAPDFPVMLRLGPNGVVIKNHGGSEEQAEAIAYAQRLVQLAGEFLGLDAFSAMECAFAGGRCFVFSEGPDETVALRPRADANLAPLRERLGL